MSPENGWRSSQHLQLIPDLWTKFSMVQRVGGRGGSFLIVSRGVKSEEAYRAWARVEQPLVQILVIVASNQKGTLMAEVTKGFEWTAFGLEWVDPKQSRNWIINLWHGSRVGMLTYGCRYPLQGISNKCHMIAKGNQVNIPEPNFRIFHLSSVVTQKNLETSARAAGRVLFSF